MLLRLCHSTSIHTHTTCVRTRCVRIRCVRIRCVRSSDARLDLNVLLYVTADIILFFATEESKGLILSDNLQVFLQQCIELVLDSWKPLVPHLLSSPPPGFVRDFVFINFATGFCCGKVSIFHSFDRVPLCRRHAL